MDKAGEGNPGRRLHNFLRIYPEWVWKKSFLYWKVAKQDEETPWASGCVNFNLLLEAELSGHQAQCLFEIEKHCFPPLFCPLLEERSKVQENTHYPNSTQF